jgi:uncharacterized membrane protein AbrB (regulator of aidB expression)
MPTFQRAWLLIVLILLVHVAAIFSGFYETNRWLDIPMHFSGGFAIAMLGLATWNATIQKITFQKSLKPIWQQAVYLVGILGIVALVGVAWEWYEYIFDSLMVQYRSDYYPAQMGLGDTMADLALDLLGAALAFTFFRNRSEK